MQNLRQAHKFYMAREVGKIWRCSCWEKANFVMINEFKYGQTWKIWPSPLSLSLYNKRLGTPTLTWQDSVERPMSSLWGQCKDKTSNITAFCWKSHIKYMKTIHSKNLLEPIKTLKYWVVVQRGQSCLKERRFLFSLGWPPF